MLILSHAINKNKCANKEDPEQHAHPRLPIGVFSENDHHGRMDDRFDITAISPVFQSY